MLKQRITLFAGTTEPIWFRVTTKEGAGVDISGHTKVVAVLTDREGGSNEIASDANGDNGETLDFTSRGDRGWVKITPKQVTFDKEKARYELYFWVYKTASRRKRPKILTIIDLV